MAEPGSPAPGSPAPGFPASVAETGDLLARGGYIADRALATTVHLALSMQRPLFTFWS